MAVHTRILHLLGAFVLVTLAVYADDSGGQFPPDPYGDLDRSHGSEEINNGEELLELSIENHVSERRHLDAEFNREAFDKFTQCLCGMDNGECEAVVNGDKVVEVNMGPMVTLDLSSNYICAAVDGVKITCKRANDKGQLAFTVSGDNCPLQKVKIFWVKTQRVDVFVRKGYASSVLRCPGRCEDIDDRNGHGLSKPVIAVMVICITLFVVAVVVIVVCLIKTKQPRLCSKVAILEKAKPIDSQYPEKAIRTHEIDGKFCPPHLPPLNPPYGTTIGIGRGNFEPGAPPIHHGLPMLDWTTDARFIAPPYEIAPPPYNALFKPLEPIREDKVITATAPTGQVILLTKEPSGDMSSKSSLKRDKRRALDEVTQ